MKRYFVFTVLFVLVSASIAEAQTTFSWRRYFRLPPEIRELPEKVAALEASLAVSESKITQLETDLALANGKITGLENANAVLDSKISVLEQGSVHTEFRTLMVLGAMSAAIIGVEAGQLLHADIMDMVDSYDPGISYVQINGERQLWTQEREDYWKSRADAIETAYGYVAEYTTEYREKVDSLSGQDHQTLLAKVRVMISQAVDNFDDLLVPDE